jgi:hypothetical protein
LAHARPKGSVRSNRIDGEALAIIDTLTRTLKDADGPKFKVRLITRAWTLILVAREQHRLPALLHPRLIRPDALYRQPAPGERVGGATQEEERLEHALVVALTTFHSQAWPEFSDDEVDAKTLQAPIEGLYDAWEEFERARYTIGLHTGPDPDAARAEATVTDGELQQALEWFREDTGMIQLVQRHVDQSLSNFREATFNLRNGVDAPVKALVESAGPAGRDWVFPLTAELLGPMAFRGTETGDFLRIEDLAALPRRNGLGLAEQYLAWSLQLAGENRGKLAEVYATGAQYLAETLGRREAGWIEAEARLMLARFKRIGGLAPDASGGPVARWEQRRKHLDKDVPAGDPRAKIERALLDLELCLTLAARDKGVVQHPPELSSMEDLAGQFAVEATACPGRVLPTICLALALVCHLATARPGSVLWDANDAALLHKDLHRRLTVIRAEWQRPPLPPLVRAVELIGFQRFPVMPGGADAVHETNSLLIPADIRGDALAVLDSFVGEARATEQPRPAGSGSALADFVVRELDLVRRQLFQNQSRDLIYAPIWAAHLADRVVASIDDPTVRDLARRAYAILTPMTGGTQEYGVHEKDRTRLEEVRDLMRPASDRLAGTPQKGSQAAFVLRMEVCYCDLLLSQLVSRNERVPALRGLGNRYAAIARDFPEAAMPHFRRNVVLGELREQLEDDDDAKEALRREAREALERAIELWPGDAYRPADPHWVVSTMNRRKAADLVQPLARARETWTAGPPDEATEASYLDGLTDAIEPLCKVYWDLAPDADFLFRLEHRRLLNNIVYYASLVREFNSSWGRLAPFGLDEVGFRRKLEALHADGFEAVREPPIGHTIGFAYKVLGDERTASAIGRHLIDLLMIENSMGVSLRNELFNDARHWIRADREISLAEEI